MSVTIAATSEIHTIEEELKALQKQRQEVEQRLKGLESKKPQEGHLKGKESGNNRSGAGSNKRLREEREPYSTSNRREPVDRNRNADNDHLSKKSRLSSVVSKQGDSRNDRERHREKDRDSSTSGKPKLTSAIVSTNPVPVVGEKPRPSLNTNSTEAKSRNKKLFGVILGTLNSFKSDITKKSQSSVRREELEQKVQAKVIQEQENFVELQRRNLQEEKEKELALREDIKKKQEEKELELLTLKWQQHRNQLSNFIRTETKPYIYYRPVDISDVKQHTSPKQDQPDQSVSSIVSSKSSDNNSTKEEHESNNKGETTNERDDKE